MRTTITLPDSLYQKALQRMAERDFIAFSDYLQHLVREDTRNIVLPAETQSPGDTSSAKAPRAPRKRTKRKPKLRGIDKDEEN
jgi:hypothetical protein